MELLATLKAQDIEADAPAFDYRSFKPRAAARGIVFDGEKVALIYISKHGYYMLPGGGLDDDEMGAGLAREIQEELGYEIEITGEVGSISVYFDRWCTKQIDYCYSARVVGDGKSPTLTDFEIEEGHQIVWAANIRTAIQLITEAMPDNRDGKLVRARDLLFLQEAVTSS